ncbi:secreted RxLR effector protein 161-like [Salvia splendens]|uniref:secreted RxLR effector protein 161-like n=1 Tax=Salvia splendens TaxID=180675 RepID=UPI001C26CF40|nr:secreted RxLR effector protein 161-like [Salvia splendens]
MKRITYASVIGSIMYAMISTRPDVAYALSMTGRFQQNPGEEHWKTVKTILKYLRRTKEYFLVYGGQPELSVIGYTDASFQTDHDDYKSQSGYVFVLNGGAVSWNSSKQGTTADSTTEAEYIASSEAAKEATVLATPSEKGKAPARDEKSQDKLDEMQLTAHSAVILCLGDKVLRDVQESKTAMQILEKLDEQLEEFNKIIDDLGFVDVKISDEDKAILTLIALPSSYNQLSDAIIYGRDKPITYT